MKSAGIITFHQVFNFGAVLQAWSLVQILRRLGHEPVVIDYRPRTREPMRDRRGMRRFVPSVGLLRMQRFVQEQLPLTQTLRTAEDMQAHLSQAGYAALVCGSDQVWLIEDRHGFERAYFLDFEDVGGARRLSYAPSAGNSESFGQHTQAVRRALARFDAVSARDLNTLRLLRTVGIDNAVHVVDPTLLADFESIVTPPWRKRRYVAVVGPTNAAAQSLIVDVARRLDAKIVAVASRCEVADVKRPFASPDEWVGAIARADFVVTSLFHGAALAIRFRKPFLALGTASRGFKITDLLARFGLSDRFLAPRSDGKYDATGLELELSYGQAEALIQNQVSASMTYLRGALGD